MRRIVGKKSKNNRTFSALNRDLERFTAALPRIRREIKALLNTLCGVPCLSGVPGKYGNDPAPRRGADTERDVPPFRKPSEQMSENSVFPFRIRPELLLPDAGAVLDSIRARLPETDVFASLMNPADPRNSAASPVQERAAKAAEETVKILKKIQKNTENEGCYQ